MHFIIGLGNPGSEYEGTRHNLGFAVADALARKLRIGFSEGKGDYMAGWHESEQGLIGIVKPLTYMNNSGIAVRDLVDTYKVDIPHLLVVADDFNLPLGSLRLRPLGTDGGHNGLYSIIYHLQSIEFPRLRCGIAGDSMPKNKSEVTAFVLSPFDKDEKDAIQRLVERAADAAWASVTEGLQEAMSKFNTKTMN